MSGYLAIREASDRLRTVLGESFATIPRPGNMSPMPRRSAMRAPAREMTTLAIASRSGSLV